MTCIVLEITGAPLTNNSYGGIWHLTWIFVNNILGDTLSIHEEFLCSNVFNSAFKQKYKTYIVFGLSEITVEDIYLRGEKYLPE